MRDLGARATEAKTAEEACAIAAQTLSEHGKLARLAGAAGVAADDRVTPSVIELSAESADGRPWPLAEVVRTGVMQVVDDYRLGTAVPPGPWPDPPRQAVVIPIRSNIPHQLAGFLVAGVSAQLKLDELYRSFYDLVANQIATAIANARAYETERKRAEALAASEQRARSPGEPFVDRDDRPVILLDLLFLQRQRGNERNIKPRLDAHGMAPTLGIVERCRRGLHGVREARGGLADGMVGTRVQLIGTGLWLAIQASRSSASSANSAA